MASQTPIITGSCRCQTINYYTTTPPLSSTCNYCHCRTCQRVSGSAFIPFADFTNSSVFFSSPSNQSSSSSHAAVSLPEAAEKIPELKTYRATPHATRFFCGNCGSQLGMRYDADLEVMHLTLGTMDEESAERVESGLKPAGHIFVREKAWWFDLPDDGTSRHETMTGDEKLLAEK